MRLEGRGINLQAGTECICLLLFGYLIFHLTYSGEYLNYVTPRMKPYLYGLSVLMVIWAAAEGRYLLAPQYKAKLARSFVLILPALMLSVHLPAPGESSMAKSYDNAGPFMAAGNGGRVSGEKKTPAPLPDITITETEEDTETAADRQEEEKSQGQGLTFFCPQDVTISVTVRANRYIFFICF